MVLIEAIRYASMKLSRALKSESIEQLMIQIFNQECGSKVYPAKDFPINQPIRNGTKVS